MNCPSCGSEMTDGTKFCINCGAELTEKKESEVVAEPIVEVVEETSEVFVQPPSGMQGQPGQPAGGDKTGFAIAGLVLGIVSFIAWLIPLIGYPITIVGIVMSVKGMKSSAKGLAIAGLVLCIIMLLLTLGNSCIGACIALARVTY